MTNKPDSIDAYIAGFPEDKQQILKQLHATVREAAPAAEEAISYGMPTLKLNGNLIHFAAFTHHIGLYPTPAGIDEFKEELAAYKGAKGSVQFPIDKPLPFELITRIVKFRVSQNQKKAEAKAKPKKQSVQA